MTDFQRVEMAHCCEDAIRARAKARQLATLAQNQALDAVPVKLPERDNGEARDELGKMAGVSGFTYSHAAAVIESAPAPFPLRLTAFPFRPVSE